MPKIRKSEKKKSNKKDNKYNADNEIIIGVTTKPKEKVRVEKKTTRTNAKPNQNKVKSKTQKSKKQQTTLSKKNVPNKSVKINNKNGVTNNTKVNKKEVTKEKEIKKSNRKKIIISIFILILIALGGTIYYLTTPAFNIAHIGVYGNNKNSVDTYISLSKIEIGSTNIFAINNGIIKKNIKENAYVENVEMKRKLPNTVELYITERKVDYQIEYSDKYMYINEQGYLLEISEEKKDVPSIKGLSLVKEDMQVGQRANNDDLQKLDIVLKIINYCKYNSIENKITAIDVSNTSNYTLIFEREGKKAYLGDASNLSERILWLKTILQKEKGNKGEIFINGDLNKDKVYFREEVKK